MERARDHNAIGQAPQTLKFTHPGDIRTATVGRPPEPGDRRGCAVDTDVRTWRDPLTSGRLFGVIAAIEGFRLPIGSSHDITMWSVDKWVNLWTNIIFDLRSTPFVVPLQGGPFQLSPDPAISAEHRLHQAYFQQIFSLLVLSLGSNSCVIPQDNPGDA